MRIDKDHLYYGAAVIQIAEHPSFTAINDFQRNNATVRCAYWVNRDIGIYLKYRTTADRMANSSGKDANAYLFVFNDENLDHIKNMKRRGSATFIGFVCVEDKQICCLSAQELDTLITRRRKANGNVESQYTVVVALPKRSKFRVYVTAPRRRNRALGEPILVAQRTSPTDCSVNIHPKCRITRSSSPHGTCSVTHLQTSRPPVPLLSKATGERWRTMIVGWLAIAHATGLEWSALPVLQDLKLTHCRVSST